MRLALNGATIMRSPLEQDVALAAACGFSALEVWAGKLHPYLERESVAALAARLREAGVASWSINSIEDITFRDAAGRRALLADLGRLVEIARAIAAPAIVVVPGRRDAAPARREVVRESVGVLREMADIAGDVALAFEFLGKPGCVVPTLDLAIEIVNEADRPNVGMVLDTFHFHAGGSDLRDIAALPMDRLLVVHLNGCDDVPPHALTDAHRRYPGEGPIPVGAILSALRAGGYDGVASVEIFRPEYWERDPHEVARTAYKRAADVLSAAGFVLDGGSAASAGGAAR
ncbi:MAG TPA: sugar phosphate isomerase/epimerase [Dehalococcoidia bacterium]|nr:sugar phosphate isomerase/epimerase [Dehalococcoidia bacterium]